MNVDVSLADIAAVVLALVALAKALWTKPQERRANDANTSSTFAEAARVTAEQVVVLQKRLNDLEAEITALEERVAEKDRLIARWQHGIGILINQLVENHLEPKWTPASETR